MILHVYDENVFEVPVEWTEEQCMDFLRPMVEPSTILPGFVCPAKVKWGPSWGETEEIGVLRNLNIAGNV